MVWVQACACFVVWVGYGFWMRRSSEGLRVRMSGQSRRRRAALGSAGLLAGLAVLGLGLWLVYRFGGLTERGLTPLGWLAVGLTGLVFVHMQVLGAAAMVSLVLEEVTLRATTPSVNQENDSHE